MRAHTRPSGRNQSWTNKFKATLMIYYKTEGKLFVLHCVNYKYKFQQIEVGLFTPCAWLVFSRDTPMVQALETTQLRDAGIKLWSFPLGKHI